ncbi:MAG: 30S ribosomal protein S20 [Clostridia bacterium]|nr:30S ribosomal protein S20 [Clostridia bacterium]
MPNIKSAKKRVLVTAKKNLENKSFKSAYKTVIKKYEAAIEAGDAENAKKLYTEVIKCTDKAAAKGVIHKNTAARKKSRFTLMLKKLAA